MTCPVCWPLEEMRNRNVVIKLDGDKEIRGVLKNFDTVGNLVIGETVLTRPGTNVPSKFTPRKLGATVIRAPYITSINVE